MKISIHAPREGSDGEDVRGDPSFSFISIHAPREGSDAVIVYFLSFLSNFNPRSPRGERPDAPQRHNRTARFQSTLPARGATSIDSNLRMVASYFNPRSPRGERPRRHTTMSRRESISIHAPREGSDRRGKVRERYNGIFQSTLPARGATSK